MVEFPCRTTVSGPYVWDHSLPPPVAVDTEVDLPSALRAYPLNQLVM